MKHVFGALTGAGRDGTACVKCGLPEANEVHVKEPPAGLLPQSLTERPILTDQLPAVIADVLQERKRQDKKFGDQRGLPDGRWLGIEAEELAEAFADACRLVLHPDEKGHEAQGERLARALRTELIQVAAVAVAWVESIDSRLARQTPS